MTLNEVYGTLAAWGHVWTAGALARAVEEEACFLGERGDARGDVREVAGAAIAAAISHYYSAPGPLTPHELLATRYAGAAWAVAQELRAALLPTA